MIIAENIDFITMCPSLKHLDIIPADSSEDNFDYSPLYDMPCIKSLSCCTIYGAKEELSTSIDCSKIKGLEDIHVTNSKYHNFEKIKTLKQLAVSDYEKEDLTDLFESNQLDTLTVITSKIKSLEGIQKSNKMQCLYLYYNRRLQDISALKKVKSTLRALCIENSSKIKDFSVLGELENLEYLVLFGSNNLPNLSFLKTMKNLKTFIFTVNVLDGDLTPCLDLSYVYCSKMHKHYNLKDKDLPRGKYVRGNEDIESWRQHR